jgi:ABC-type uncharacterized transport system, periplasmic component
MMTGTPSRSCLDRRTFLGVAAGFAMLPALRARAAPADWAATLEAARGKTIYWHAWGGDPRINDYIGWVTQRAQARFDVTLKHVKVDDTANVVQAVLAEKAAGVVTNGSVDLVWINGENFAAMRQNGLLQAEPWAAGLPNFRFVDTTGKPTTVSDFTIPTDGLEAPWGMAQLVFFHDSAVLADPPRSLRALVEWTKANPGRFTYPAPPDFVGSTFLKQVMVDLAPDTSVLYRPLDPAAFTSASAGVFALLDDMHPHLWRQGRTFPVNYTALRQLMSDGEIDIAFAFNPAAASNAIAAGELPDTVRSFVFDGGTIGNTHFVAIPFNSGAPEAAMVVADFLLSPEAQARKQDPAIWGDPTVLDVAALDGEDAARFAAIDLGPATPTPSELGRALPEPHPSWMEAMEAEWLRRYSA